MVDLCDLVVFETGLKGSGLRAMNDRNTDMYSPLLMPATRNSLSPPGMEAIDLARA